MITLMQAIQELRPGAQCRISGDTYNDIMWDDENQRIPTEDEVNEKLKELQTNEPFKLLREERNKLIAETDWTQGRDVTLSNDLDWRTYRQALRDLPSNSNPKLDSNGRLDMSSVTWPTKPSS
mgnify:CR=1 FL=1